MALTRRKDGYNEVAIYKNGKRNVRKVSQIMAMAFLNHKPNGFKNVVDHIDNNPQNDVLSNLQIITHRKNCSKDKKGGYSDYPGVTWHKHKNRWQAQIKIKRKSIYIGMYKTEIEAAKAYQNKLKSIQDAV